MTTERYEDAVAAWLDGIDSPNVGACPGCDDCGLADDADDDAVQLAEEPNFSWTQCDACGSTLGGDRHPAHGFLAGPEPLRDRLVHLSVCTDCVFYLTYGDAPEEWRAHA